MTMHNDTHSIMIIVRYCWVCDDAVSLFAGSSMFAVVEGYGDEFAGLSVGTKVGLMVAKVDGFLVGSNVGYLEGLSIDGKIV